MVTGVGAGRYAAFISYSHKDAAAARALHSRLERYRIPKRLVGTPGDHGAVPARLTPIFRDRDELPASGDLSATVRAALAASDSLVVVCSPHAATSQWVAREIAAFRELNPGRPVLAAVVAGEPGECFPAELGGTDAAGTPIEPLAADLRKAGDGQRMGFLKLVAGLTGVGLDALIQRDAARAIRRVTAVTLTALAATLVMAVLTVIAFTARQEADRQRSEAERQRGEAEGMVEFMLTDLRTKLKGVGRIEVLDIVNARALDYYGKQQALAQLSPDSLERRARVLHAIGEDEENKGNLDAAEARFTEAARTTATLLAADPSNPERIFAQSQSEFWLGTISYRRHDLGKARAAFEQYKALADRLVAINPRDPKWLSEAAYAEGALCNVAMEKPLDLALAERSCAAALTRMERAAQVAGDGSLDTALVTRHTWLVGIYAQIGKMSLAAGQADAADKLLAGMIARDPRNLDYQDLWLRLQLATAVYEVANGDPRAARTRLAAARQRAGSLVRTDPQNKQWSFLKREVDQAMSSTLH